MRAVAECFKIIGGIPSPPIALEGSREIRAEKVYSVEIDRAESLFSKNGKSERSGSWVQGLNTEWKYLLNRPVFFWAVVTSWEPRERTSGSLPLPERLLIYRKILESFKEAKCDTKLLSWSILALAIEDWRLISAEERWERCEEVGLRLHLFLRVRILWNWCQRSEWNHLGKGRDLYLTFGVNIAIAWKIMSLRVDQIYSMSVERSKC